MAIIYQIKCPKCGHEFKEMKGPLMSEMEKKLPASRDENAPFQCPVCGMVFCTKDRDFHSYVTIITMAD